MKKYQNKTSMTKAMMPFRDSQALSWLPGTLTNASAEPPSHRHCVLPRIIPGKIEQIITPIDTGFDMYIFVIYMKLYQIHIFFYQIRTI